MQIENEKRHNDDMSEMPQDQKPAMEEDVKISRILGAVLLVVIPVFGFYFGTVFGKTNAVDGVIWYYDYQLSDITPGMKGAAIGLVIAAILNLYIWFRYKAQTENDLIHEWYDPQSHHSGGHH